MIDFRVHPMQTSTSILLCNLVTLVTQVVHVGCVVKPAFCRLTGMDCWKLVAKKQKIMLIWKGAVN